MREQRPKLARRYYQVADTDRLPRLVARLAGFPGCKSARPARSVPHPLPVRMSRLNLLE
jgi:hypothetical protein